jgi:hypothetical protein
MRRLKKLSLAAVISAMTLFLGSSLTRAQDPQPPEDVPKPKPAARGVPPVAYPDQDPSGVQDSTPPLQPDSRPLTGVQNPTLGSPEIGHSYFVPGVQFLDTARSISLNQAAGSDWSSTNYVVGNLSLYRVTSHSELSANYTGGGYFSTAGAQGNGHFHEVGLTEGFKWRRWQLSLIDEFSYLPESSFGFGLGTGISVPGINGGLAPSLPGLQTSYQPNQSILTSIGTRYSNSFTTEVVYAISPRSSINVDGSYAILRFLDPGNIDSDTDILNVGYNYQISKEDAVGVLYRFTEYHFLGTPQGLTDHAIHLAYGRKITGRVALQFFGGPEIAIFRVPVDNETQRISPSGGVTLSYAMPRGAVSLTYNHGVSNGGGILIGSNTDQVRLELDRQISRHWQGSISFGLARNQGLGNFLNVNQSGQGYDSYVAGGALGRRLGRNANLSLAYSARIQTSTQNVCAAGSCNTSYTQHQVTLGLAWHARPFVLH